MLRAFSTLPPCRSHHRSEELLAIKRRPPFQDHVGGAAEPLRDDRQALRLPILADKLLMPSLRFLALAKEDAGRLAEGPLEMGVADLVVLPAGPLGGRLVGALHQPCVGDELPHRREPCDVADLIEDGEREGLPGPGDRAQQLHGDRVVASGLIGDLPLDKEDLLVKRVQQI